MTRIDPRVVFDRMGFQQVSQDTEVEWLARCPNPHHADHTPSFYVNLAKGKFYCFGCQYKGYLITLLEQRLSLDHLDAAILTARMQPTNGSQAPRRRDRVLPELFLQQFHQLQSSEYLAKRGITIRTAHTFGIRYDDVDNCLVIPMRNAKGQLVGWVKRTLTDQKPKYRYSPEFPKSTELFNFTAIKSWGRAIVVEGVFDVLRVHQAGYWFAVATLGNALSIEQVALLRTCVNRVWLAFDNDVEGQGKLFTQISRQRLQEKGILVRRVVIPKHRKDLGECTTMELHHILRRVKPHGYS